MSPFSPVDLDLAPQPDSASRLAAAVHALPLSERWTARRTARRFARLGAARTRGSVA